MKITVINGLKIQPHEALKLANELMQKGYKPGTFNYGFMTKGVFDGSLLIETPIQVKQKYGTDRKNEYSPLEIVIEKHYPLF